MRRRMGTWKGDGRWGCAPTFCRPFSLLWLDFCHFLASLTAEHGGSPLIYCLQSLIRFTHHTPKPREGHAWWNPSWFGWAVHRKLALRQEEACPWPKGDKVFCLVDSRSRVGDGCRFYVLCWCMRSFTRAFWETVANNLSGSAHLGAISNVRIFPISMFFLQNFCMIFMKFLRSKGTLNYILPPSLKKSRSRFQKINNF